jgi:uncharacterized membrane protein YqjE
MSDYYAGKDQRSIGDLLSELSSESRDLVTKEIQLAKVELNEKVSQVQRGLISLSIGGAVLYAGILSLVAAAVFGLGYFIPLWLSALIIGVVIAIIGYFMVSAGKEDLKPKNLSMHETKSSLEEGRQWAKAQMR